MGRILFCWEQGANLGHLARMLAVAGPLAQRGHQIGFLLRDLSRAELILGANGFAEAYTQAPVWLPKASHPPPALNYASVLIHAGWLDPQGLLGLCRAWRKQFELFSPDLLIFDVHFPVETNVHWDGFTVMEWLERLHQDWQKPLIIITGEEGKDYESRVKAVGALAFFRKPVDYHELLAVIRGELEEETPAGNPAK